MPDFESVAKALYVCKKRMTDRSVFDCSGCPYKHKSMAYNCWANLFDDAFKLLRRQQELIEQIKADLEVSEANRQLLLKEQKTVVQCKDCRFFRDYCHRFETMDERPLSNPYWYCADGERNCVQSTE